MVPLRFEVTLNGRVLCTSGMDQRGVLVVTVQSEDSPPPGEAETMRGTPAGEESILVVDGYTNSDLWWRWVSEKIVAGDEIRIRVLPSGSFDPPTSVSEPDDGDDE
jgi:hypothetical protein